MEWKENPSTPVSINTLDFEAETEIETSVDDSSEEVPSSPMSQVGSGRTENPGPPASPNRLSHIMEELSIIRMEEEKVVGKILEDIQLSSSNISQLKKILGASVRHQEILQSKLQEAQAKYISAKSQLTEQFEKEHRRVREKFDELLHPNGIIVNEEKCQKNGHKIYVKLN